MQEMNNRTGPVVIKLRNVFTAATENIYLHGQGSLKTGQDGYSSPSTKGLHVGSMYCSLAQLGTQIQININSALVLSCSVYFFITLPSDAMEVKSYIINI